MTRRKSKRAKEEDYRFAPKASRRPSQSFTTNSRQCHGIAKSPSEFNALGGVLGIKCVGIFNEQVRVEQFVRVFVRIGFGWGGAAEMNHLLVARHDGVDRRILPRPQTFEAKLGSVVGERSGNVHS